MRLRFRGNIGENVTFSIGWGEPGTGSGSYFLHLLLCLGISGFCVLDLVNIRNDPVLSYDR